MATQPKIEAATVAEHRAQQRRALLDAAERVLLTDGADAVSRESTPSAQIEAYARTTLELAAAGRHLTATALSGVDLGESYRARLGELHRGLTEPLVGALQQRGDHHADTTAALVQGALGAPRAV